MSMHAHVLHRSMCTRRRPFARWTLWTPSGRRLICLDQRCACGDTLPVLACNGLHLLSSPAFYINPLLICKEMIRAGRCS
jgi:hypothetical protein